MTKGAGFIPYRHERLDIAEQSERVASFRRAMAGRRSIRLFSPDPVPGELIDGAITIANSAPSGANLQPWHFVVVGEPGVKREIRLAAEKEERENYRRRFPEEWKEAIEPLGTDWHKEFLEVAPWLIVLFRVDGSTGTGGRRRKHYYVSESVGIAAGFLLAALQIAGLATLTHTPSPMGFLTEILGRPANEKPFLLIPVGYPAPDCRVPNLTKKPLDVVRTWIE